jgi:hypothetical protein
MANEYSIVAGCVQAAVNRVVQRGLRQRAPALQQQMLIQYKVAFIRGLKSG